MLKPSVEVGLVGGILVAEFWDCLRLDPVPVQGLRKEFESHLQSGGRPDLVVDLLGVGFAGSAALGGFVAIQRLSRAKGGRMVFCNTDPTVYEVFRVSKLVNLYTFAPDRSAALAALEIDPATTATDTGEPTTPAPRPKSDPTGESRLRRKPREE